MSSVDAVAADTNTPSAEGIAAPPEHERMTPVQTVGGQSATGGACTTMRSDGSVAPAASGIVVGRREGVDRQGFVWGSFVGGSARHDWDRSPERTVVPPLPGAPPGSRAGMSTEEVSA